MRCPTASSVYSPGQKVSTQTLLVVDDDPTVLALVDETLRQFYRIRVTTNGLQALSVLDRSPAVDLILLDVVMPEMDGFETCRRIKAMPAWCDIPVIFLTSESETEDEAYGLGLGAVDYIAKPVIPIILKARVNTQMELCRVRQELQKKNEILSSEREVIEGMILRMRIDPEFDDRHLRWLMQPVERTSGDICLSAFCPDGRQMVLVGDFTGHGLTAAIAGPSVKQAFYALCANCASMSQTLATLNELMYAQLLVSQFMAGHLVEVDSARQQVCLWGGGMPAVLHVNTAGVVRQVPVSGLPLGVMPGQDISDKMQTLSVQAGDRLLLYTDGMIEATNVAGEMYRVERLEARYAALLQRGEALDELAADLDAFALGRQQEDDRLLLELTL
ncbi:two-component system, HptB-dependent secretion and biofilm response regulator [Gammaproteobacteria bacterium]